MTYNSQVFYHRIYLIGTKKLILNLTPINVHTPTNTSSKISELIKVLENDSKNGTHMWIDRNYDY